MVRSAKSDDSTKEWIPWDDPRIPELLWQQLRELAANCVFRIDACPDESETRDLLATLRALEKDRAFLGEMAGKARHRLAAIDETPLVVNRREAADHLLLIFCVPEGPLSTDGEALKRLLCGLMGGALSQDLLDRIHRLAHDFVMRARMFPEVVRLTNVALGERGTPSEGAIQLVEKSLRKAFSEEDKSRRDPENLAIKALVALGATREKARALLTQSQ